MTQSKSTDATGKARKIRTRFPAVEIAGDIYLFHPGRELIYRYKGRTINPRVIALHDAVAYDDALLTAHTDGGLIELQHYMAGVEEMLVASELLDEPVGYFEEVQQLRAGEVAQRVMDDE